MGSGWKPRKLIHRPSRKAVQAGIAAQAPPEWEPKAREKMRRKLVDDEIPELVKDDPESP